MHSSDGNDSMNNDLNSCFADVDDSKDSDSDSDQE